MEEGPVVALLKAKLAAHEEYHDRERIQVCFRCKCPFAYSSCDTVRQCDHSESCEYVISCGRPWCLHVTPPPCVTCGDVSCDVSQRCCICDAFLCFDCVAPCSGCDGVFCKAHQPDGRCTVCIDTDKLIQSFKK